MSEQNDAARDPLLRDADPVGPASTTAPATPAAPAAPATPTDRRADRKAAKQDDPLRGSRTSGFWAAIIGLGVVLILLIVFIAQNTRTTTVTFLAWEGQVSVAVALLIAAVGGLFLSGLAGSLRIIQLRRRVKRGLR